MTSFRRLVAAEWLKLTRRPLTRALLAAFLVLMALQAVVNGLVVVAHAAGVGHLGAAFPPEELEEYRRRATFPGMLGAVFGHINGVGGIFAVILAGAAMGSEYDWGTLRTQLTHTPDRELYLLAKVTTLLLLVLTGALMTLALGLVLGAILGAATGGAVVPDAASLAALPAALARALFVLLPYMLVAVCLAVARRSLLFGVAGGLVYLVLEAGFGAVAIFSALGEPWRTLYDLTIGQNINALTLLNCHVFGLHPEAVAKALRPELLPSPGRAAVVVGVYCAGLFALTLRAIRRDVTARA